MWLKSFLMPMQQAARYGKEIVGCELEFVWEDGIFKIAQWSAIPLKDENGIICGCIATMEDITDVVHMSRELDRHKSRLEELVEKRTSELLLSEMRFTKVFYASPHAMSINRKSDLSYLDVNNQWLSMSNYKRVEVIGKTPLEIGVPENEYKSFMKLWNERESVSNMESSLIKDHKIGGDLIISAESIEINGEECILFASNNITEMKRLQAELTRLDRLNLVGQLAAGIGHEIRNPMTTVRGYLQLMGVKPDYAALKPTFDLMISELDRANSIITEFLSLAQTKQTPLESQNLNNILTHLYPLLEADTFTQNKQIRFIPGDIPDLELNANEISQLVLNLTRNGLEAMQERGCLTIEIYLQNGMVVLAIADEAFGIPPENKGMLGTPFFTTKANGTGLGLSICYRIAESHNANIRVDSSPRGTTFHIFFPIPIIHQSYEFLHTFSNL